MTDMNYSEAARQYPSRSEAIEAAYQHMIGTMGMRYFSIREDNSSTLADKFEAAKAFWGMIESINLQTILLQNVPHSSIAASNEMRQVAKMIDEDLGFNPLDRKFRSVTFNSDTSAWDEAYKLALSNTEESDS